MKRIKLIWYKWLLKRAYLKYLELGDGADCGRALLREIYPEFTRQEVKVEQLFTKCQSLEV